jgi:hypothetical protein
MDYGAWPYSFSTSVDAIFYNSSVNYLDFLRPEPVDRERGEHSLGERGTEGRLGERGLQNSVEDSGRKDLRSVKR